MSVRVQLQVIAEHRNMLIMSMMRNNIPSATASHRSHSGCTPSSCNMLMGNRSPDEFYLCTQRCRIGNALLNCRQTGTWKTMWHPLYRSYIKVIIIGLPFVVYKLHAGIELVEREAVLNSNPVRSCKLNVQRNSASDSKLSRRNRG
ncbi:hypothetical protein ALC57_08184 [Trachymyrmex cornetzi]|uniref:Uncharacterized protein n=1 Tax=Trachymyrmex cornetzi TaxID=471704 RepID=A0A195E3F6_9HYME|nr:hypothetical protein ALC57_08184 [Trachymyrmex cornetzi]